MDSNINYYTAILIKLDNHSVVTISDKEINNCIKIGPFININDLEKGEEYYTLYPNTNQKQFQLNDLLIGFQNKNEYMYVIKKINNNYMNLNTYDIAYIVSLLAKKNNTLPIPIVAPTKNPTNVFH